MSKLRLSDVFPARNPRNNLVRMVNRRLAAAGKRLRVRKSSPNWSAQARDQLGAYFAVDGDVVVQADIDPAAWLKAMEDEQ